MTITINSKFTQPNGKSDRPTSNNVDLKPLFEKVLGEKGELDSSKVKWKDDETVELNSVSNMTLHSFLLEAEKLGKDVTYEKTTTIKINN